MTLILSPSLKNIETCAKKLQEDEIVAFPTETVYGLGGNVFSYAAIKKIFDAKGRPSDNPLIVHISSVADVEKLAVEIPEDFFLLANHFFPGPLTVILKKNSQIPPIVSGGRETIAIRMPNHLAALELIKQAGFPLAAPSANKSGCPSSTTAKHVDSDFHGEIPFVLDGGPCAIGIESTVISLIDHRPIILRPGTISKETIENVLKKPVLNFTDISSNDSLISPGMKYRHYAPKASIKLFESKSALEEYKNKTMHTCQILYPTQQSLYAAFRKADEKHIEEILLLCDSSIQSDFALMNRILKACDKNL